MTPFRIGSSISPKAILKVARKVGEIQNLVELVFKSRLIRYFETTQTHWAAPSTNVFLVIIGLVPTRCH